MFLRSMGRSISCIFHAHPSVRRRDHHRLWPNAQFESAHQFDLGEAFFPLHAHQLTSAYISLHYLILHTLPMATIAYQGYRGIVNKLFPHFYIIHTTVHTTVHTSNAVRAAFYHLAPSQVLISDPNTPSVHRRLTGGAQELQRKSLHIIWCHHSTGDAKRRPEESK